ncbi:hypothetical protein HY629_00555 [Candidatus Uhrbacteria bacterium]|nr:hypothetical protein [Candidatus Uhrbacteria bacterium]
MQGINFLEAFAWASAPTGTQPPDDLYCQTRDVFQARLDTFRLTLERAGEYKEQSSLLIAVIGEIGNNSFDHNIGNWRDIPGVYFYTDVSQGMVVCADRGQGIRRTLQAIRPDIDSDRDALRIALTEKISGRAPEQRGNGLKFVRAVVNEQHWHLEMQSGDARATVNEQLSIDNSVSPVQGCYVSIRFATL